MKGGKERNGRNGLNGARKQGSGGRSTVECKYFKNGYCRRGQQCQYRHTARPYKRIECRDFQKGLCRRGRQCKYEHSQGPTPVRSRTPSCRDYNLGMCKRGYRCRYAHSQQGVGGGYGEGRPEYREMINPHQKPARGAGMENRHKSNDREMCWYFEENKQCPFYERGCKYTCYGNLGKTRGKQDKYEEAQKHISFLEERIREIRETDYPKKTMAASYPAHTQIPMPRQNEMSFPQRQRWGRLNPWRKQGVHATRAI